MCANMVNEQYERPTAGNVSVKDILVRRMNGGIRYLPITEKTDYGVHASDGNHTTQFPFHRFEEVVVLTQHDSMLVGKVAAADEAMLADVKMARLVKRASGERDLISQGSPASYCN